MEKIKNKTIENVGVALFLTSAITVAYVIIKIYTYLYL